MSTQREAELACQDALLDSGTDTAAHAFRVTHSSSVPDWRTEDALFQALYKEFTFGLDAAATLANRKTPRYFGPDHPKPERRDALTVPYWKVASGNLPIFCNPPSSREEGLSLAPWLAKFVEQAALGCTIVAVVPHKTSTSWWSLVRRAQEIREIPHRVKFWLLEDELAIINAARAARAEGSKRRIKSGDSAGFDSAVVVFRPQPGVIQPACPRVVTWSYR